VDIFHIPAALLYPCVAHDISVDNFHRSYLTLHHNTLYPCVAPDISVDYFHRSFLSIHHNPLVSFDTPCVPVSPVPSVIHVSKTVHKNLNFVFCALKYSLKVFLQHDFATFLCLLYHNLYLHAIIMHGILHEVPACRVHDTTRAACESFCGHGTVSQPTTLFSPSHQPHHLLWLPFQMCFIILSCFRISLHFVCPPTHSTSFGFYIIVGLP
jgi:hypothetical protein